MSICVDSCEPRETIVVTTRSSVYEVIVLQGDRGDVLVRGGRHFTDFRRVLFLGSAGDGDRIEPRTVDIGLRLTFMVAGQLVVTSEVQELCHRPAGATPADRPTAP